MRNEQCYSDAHHHLAAAPRESAATKLEKGSRRTEGEPPVARIDRELTTRARHEHGNSMPVGWVPQRIQEKKRPLQTCCPLSRDSAFTVRHGKGGNVKNSRYDLRSHAICPVIFLQLLVCSSLAFGHEGTSVSYFPPVPRTYFIILRPFGLGVCYALENIPKSTKQTESRK